MIRSVLLVTQYYPPERGAAQVRLGAIVRELRRREGLSGLEEFALRKQQTREQQEQR